MTSIGGDKRILFMGRRKNMLCVVVVRVGERKHVSELGYGSLLAFMKDRSQDVVYGVSTEKMHNIRNDVVSIESDYLLRFLWL
jgi:hypothetical protein